MSLRDLEADGCTVYHSDLSWAFDWKPVAVCAETRQRFTDYVNSLTTPLVGDIDPYAPRDPGQDEAAAAAHGAADADSDDEAEGEGGGGDAAAAGGSADGDFVRRGKADLVCNGVSRQQREFLARVVAERASGKRPSYEDAERLDVQPPDALCIPCFDADLYHLLPIQFWSPGVKWSLQMPCHNHGWSHSRYVRPYLPGSVHSRHFLRPNSFFRIPKRAAEAGVFFFCLGGPDAGVGR